MTVTGLAQPPQIYPTHCCSRSLCIQCIEASPGTKKQSVNNKTGGFKTSPERKEKHDRANVPQTTKIQYTVREPTEAQSMPPKFQHCFSFRSFQSHKNCFFYYPKYFHFDVIFKFVCCLYLLRKTSRFRQFFCVFKQTK